MFQKFVTSTDNNEPLMASLSLARVAVENGEKILDLNFRQVKAHLDDSSEMLSMLLSASNPQTYGALALEQSRQSFGKMLAHCTELANLTARTQASLALLVSKSLQHTRPQ